MERTISPARPARRRIAVLSVVGIIASFLALVLTPATASAAISTPAPGSTVAGIVEIHEARGGWNENASAIITSIPCDGAFTRFEVLQLSPSLQTVSSELITHGLGNTGTTNSTAPNPVSHFWDTDGLPNGEYRIRSITADAGGGLFSCGGVDAPVVRSDFTVFLENGASANPILPPTHIGGEPITFDIESTDDEGRPVAGRTVTVEVDTVGTQVVTTDADGIASLTFAIPHLPAGPLGITLTTTGDDFYVGRTTTANLNVVQRPTKITWTGDVQAFPGSEVRLEARLTDATPDSADAGQPVAGVPMSLSFQGDTVTGTTDADGRIAATTTVSGTPRSEDAVVTFDGDALWGSTSRTTVFVIADDAAARPPVKRGLVGGLLGLVGSVLTQPSGTVQSVLTLVDSALPNLTIPELNGKVDIPGLDALASELTGDLAAELGDLGGEVDKVVDTLLETLTGVPVAGDLISTLSYDWRTVYVAPDGQRILNSYSASLLGVPTPLDVDNDGFPDLMANLTVRLTQGGETGVFDLPLIPTIKIHRLPGAPADLPVSVQAVLRSNELISVGDAAGQLRFGYDTRHSNAPQDFEVRLGVGTGGFVLDVLTVKSPDPITVTGAIEGAGIDLPFGGVDEPSDDLGDLATGETRFGISFDPAPHKARIALNLGGGDADLGATFTTGHTTLVGVEFVQDNGVDESFEFGAEFDSVLGNLSLGVAAGETAPDSIAPALGLELSSDNPLDRIAIYGRGLTNGHITTDLLLDITDVPTLISFTSEDGGVALSGSDTIGVFEAGFASGGPIKPLAGEDRYLYMSTQGEHESVSIRLVGLESIAADLSSELGIVINAAPGKLRAVVEADTLAVDAAIYEAPQQLEIGLAADGAFLIEGSDVIDLITIRISDDAGILLGATDVDVRIEDIPGLLSVALDGDSVDFSTGGQAVGLLEIYATSGPEPTLPGAGDGLRLNLSDTDFLLAARIQELRRITAVVDLAAPAFVIDTGTNNIFDIDINADGIEVGGQIDHLVPNMSIGVATNEEGELSGLVYSADEPTNSMTFAVSGFADFNATPVPTYMEFAVGDNMRIFASDYFTLNLEAEVSGIQATVTNLLVRVMEFGAPLDGGGEDTGGIPLFMNTTEYSDACPDGCTYTLPSGSFVLGPIALAGFNINIFWTPAGFAADNADLVLSVEQSGLSVVVGQISQTGTVHCTPAMTMTTSAIILGITANLKTGVCASSTNLADIVTEALSAPAAVQAGSDVVHSYTARNAGPTAVINLLVDATFTPGLGTPVVTCSAGGTPAVDGGAGTASCLFGASTAVNGQRTIELTWPTDGSSIGSSVDTTFTAGSPNAGTSGTAAGSTAVFGDVAALAVTNVSATPSVVAGDQDVVHRVDVVNNGPLAAPNLRIEATATGAPGAPQVTCSPDGVATGTTCTWAGDTGVGEARWAELLWAVPAGTPSGSIEASYLATSDAAALDATTAASTTILAEEANIAVLGASGPVRILPGEVIDHSATVRNDGPSPAQNVRALADYDTELGSPTVTCSFGGTGTTFPEIGRSRCLWLGTTPVNGERSIQLTWEVAPDQAIPVTHETTFQGTSSTAGTIGSATVSTLVADVVTADIEITGTSAPATTGAGGNLVHTATATNSGPDAADDVVLSAALPSTDLIATPAVACGPDGSVDVDVDTNTATCTYGGETASGASRTMSLTWTEAEWTPVTDDELIEVGYTATSDTLGADGVGSTSTQKTPVTANLEFSTVNVPATAVPGATLGRSFVVRNNGPAATGGIVVSFELSHASAISCGSGGSASGSNSTTPSCTYASSTAVGNTRTVTLNSSAAQVNTVGVGNSFTVAATASSPLAGGTTTNASTLIVAPESNISFGTITIPEEAPDNVALSRTVVVTNDGPQTVPNLTVGFVLSHPSAITCSGGSVQNNNSTTPGCTYTSTNVGTNRTIGLNASAAQVSAVGAGNEFTVLSGTATSAQTPAPATMGPVSTLIVPQEANLSFSSVTIPAEWASGVALSRTVVLTNDGPHPVSGITASFSLSHPSAITCSGGSVVNNNTTNPGCTYSSETAVGQNRSISLNATTTQVNAIGVGNTATVSGTATSPATPAPATMGPAGTLIHGALADMIVFDGANPATVQAGSQLVQAVGARRTGPSGATNVRVIGTLDPSFPLPNTPTCSSGGTFTQLDTHLVQCQWAGSTTGNTTRTMTLTYPGAATLEAGVGATVDNAFLVESDTFGASATANRTATVVDAPVAGLVFTGVARPAVHQLGSGNLGYIVDASNLGPAAVNPFIIEATHDGSLGQPTIECAGGGSASNTGNTARCQWANTTNGTSRQMVLTFPTAAQATGVPGPFVIDFLTTSTSIAVNVVEHEIQTTTNLVAAPPPPGP